MWQLHSGCRALDVTLGSQGRFVEAFGPAALALACDVTYFAEACGNIPCHKAGGGGIGWWQLQGLSKASGAEMSTSVWPALHRTMLLTFWHMGHHHWYSCIFINIFHLRFMYPGYGGNECHLLGNNSLRRVRMYPSAWAQLPLSPCHPFLVLSSAASDHASYNISFLDLKGKAGLASYLAWFLFAHDGVRIAYATVDTILPIFLSCFFAGSAGSSPTSSQNATLPSSSAWPLSASGYSSSFSSIASAPSIAGTTNGLST